jgi:soluble lytic murein transglycosylase
MWRLVALGVLVLAAGCTGGRARPASEGEATTGAAASPRTPDAKRALFAQSYRSFEKGDFDAAARGFETLVGRYPELEDYCLHYLAATRVRRAEADDALDLWRRLASDHPKSRFLFDAKLGRGRLLRERGELAASRGELMVVLEEGNATEARAALWELALIDEAEDAVGPAYAKLMRIRQEAPGTPLGKKAKDGVVRLRAADPALAPQGEALEDELRLLITEGDPTAALDLADRLLATAATDRKPGILRLRADAERALGRFDPALQTLQEIVRTYPLSDVAPEALYRYSTWLWNRDRDGEAREGFLEHLRRYPSARRAEVLYALGRIEEAARHDEAAVFFYSDLARVAPQTKEGGEALWRIGWIRYQAGEWNAAAQAFDRALSASNSDAALYWKARALERAGELAAAVPVYERILSGDPVGYYAHWAEERLHRDSLLGPIGELDGPPHEIGTPPAPADPYHLTRARELRAAGLRLLARAELRAFERSNMQDDALERFLIDAYPAVDGYRDAIHLVSARAERDPEVLYPLAFWPLVRREAQASGIDPLLVLSLMRQESLFDPAARSPADARGLMQLLPTTAGRVAGRLGRALRVADLYEPEPNIILGVAYLDQLLREQNGDWIKALAAYNGGENALAKWESRFGHQPPDEFVESITYRETRDYVKRVLSHYRRYRQTYAASSR